MTRHVAHIEAYGGRSPERVARQRAIIEAAGRQYRPLPDPPPHDEDRPIASFGFSTRTSRNDAFARLSGILDTTDPEWRDYVRVWDGKLSDPPRHGLLGFLKELFGR
jgi:hypothetical protein